MRCYRRAERMALTSVRRTKGDDANAKRGGGNPAILRQAGNGMSNAERFERTAAQEGGDFQSANHHLSGSTLDFAAVRGL